MLVVFARHPSHLRTLGESLTPPQVICTPPNWDALPAALVGAGCAVICIEWLGESEELSRLTALRARTPEVPFVLVTRKEADNIRLVIRVQVDEVVWLHEVSHALSAAVARARTRGLFHTLHLVIRDNRELSPRLREALLHALRAEHHAFSVATLARAVRCDRRTLWHAWRRAVVEGPRLEDFLHWLILLRAAELKESARCWRDVAHTLGIDNRTLGRHAARLLGMRLSDLAVLDRRELLQRFRETVLRHLSAPSSRDNLP